MGPLSCPGFSGFLASAGAWGETLQAREPFVLDRNSGNTMLNVAVGHVTDSVTTCLGEFTQVKAVVTNRRPRARNAQTGESLPMTTDDQIAINGVLEGGAVGSMHFRGGESRATNLYWEINGTDGDLLVTGDLGYLHLGDVTIRGATRQDTSLAELTVPHRYNNVPELTGREAEPAYNVANADALLLRDLVEGTECVPTFNDAVTRHRLLDRIQLAARSSQRA